MTEEFRDSGFTPGFNFDEYIRQSEPSKKEKGKAWATAIGLQQVDGLEPSAYLYETARRNIEGEISIDEANRLVNNYYETRSDFNGEERTEEADKVSARIARILSEKSFRFSPSYLIAIHKELFDGIYRFSGVLRDYDITKKEWVLRGDTVLYGAAFELQSALDYDFEQERRFSYKDLTPRETVSHIAFFVSRLWQIHPFAEGNTRTTAVFTVKYLRTLGFEVHNGPFEKNSYYFRNALVRANYTDLNKGIRETPVFLENFFDNLLFDRHHELKNRYLHIDYKKNPQSVEDLSVHYGNSHRFPQSKKNSANDSANDSVNDSANDSANDSVNDSVKLTAGQQAILNRIKDHPFITQSELAQQTGLSVSTVIRQMKKLQAAGLLRRVGADKNGYWQAEENRL